jgi:gluconolactonase
MPAITSAAGQGGRRHDLSPALQQVQRPDLGPPGPARRLRARLEPGDAHRAGRPHLPHRHHYDGKQLNSPNDIVCAQDGGIYFSDPPYGRAEFYGVKRAQELAFQGVYRVGADPARPRCSSTTSTGPTASAFRWTGAASSSTTPPGNTSESSTCARRRPRRRRRVGRDQGRGQGRARRHEARLRRQRVLLRAGRHPRVQSRGGGPGRHPVSGVHANFAWGDRDFRTLYITASRRSTRSTPSFPGCPLSKLIAQRRLP